MKEISLKYYPAKKMFIILCVIISLVVPIKYGLFHLLGKANFHAPTWINIILNILLSVSSISIILIAVNKRVMWNVYLKWLNIPDIRGIYSGTLISSYTLNDDPSQPNITKYIKVEISQNLNGFYVKTHFYDSEFQTQESSSSESISHDIEAKDNGEYLIIYRYRNTGNNFHKDHKKYTLNKHDGIAQLYFNPTKQTLIGKYFNDSQDRPSYGNINLNKK